MPNYYNSLIKRIIISVVIAVIFVIVPSHINAANSLSQTLSGRILLQTQAKGEAWYVNPLDLKRYYLGRPADAFEIMRQLGLGIYNINFNKLSSDKDLTSRLNGRIILQVQSAGQAWYISPADGQKYYLGRPDDAFTVMKKLGLGISEENITKIKIGYFNLLSNQPADNLNDSAATDKIIKDALAAFSRGDSGAAVKYFTPQFKKIIEYSINFLNADGRSAFADLLNSLKISDSTAEEKKYSTIIYLSGYQTNYNLTMRKQPDGSWLIANL